MICCNPACFFWRLRQTSSPGGCAVQLQQAGILMNDCERDAGYKNIYA